MEFEDLQQIWHQQENRFLYTIDESALHRRIIEKKNKAGHLFYASEFLLILVNLGCGITLLTMHFPAAGQNIARYLVAGWMFLTAFYVIVNFFRRSRAVARFDRSMLGDLDHAVALAGYQVSLSRLMRWNMLPLCFLIILWLQQSGNSVSIIAGIIVFFIGAWLAGGGEHRYYQRRRRELQGLRDKLKGDD